MQTKRQSNAIKRQSNANQTPIKRQSTRSNANQPDQTPINPIKRQSNRRSTPGKRKSTQAEDAFLSLHTF
jgi:hypothetical protein